MEFSTEAKSVYEKYHAENRKLREAADPFDDALLGRLKSCPTLVVKLAMIFESCRTAFQNKQLVKSIGLDCLIPAISHVDEHMRASSYLDKYAELRSVDEKAESYLAIIQATFPRWGNSVYATRSQLTRKFMLHPDRRGSLTVTDFYGKIIPRLQDRGECTRVVKDGRLEVYAFLVEPGDNNGGNSPNSPVPEGQMKIETPTTPGEIGENKSLSTRESAYPSVSPTGEIGENAEIASGRITQQPSVSTPVENVEKTFHVVNAPDQIDCAFQSVEGVEPVALDIETYGDHPSHALDVRRGEIRLVSLAARGKPMVVFDLRELGPQPWANVLNSGRLVIGHNIRFDAEWIREKLDVSLPKLFCTWSAAKLISNGDISLRNDLGSVLERYVGVTLPKELGKSDWGSWCLTDDQYQYAVHDVLHLHKLAALLTREIKRLNMWRVWQLEMDLLPIVVDMQSIGIPVSRSMLEELSSDSSAICKERESALKSQLGAACCSASRMPRSTARGMQRRMRETEGARCATSLADHNRVREHQGAPRQISLSKLFANSIATFAFISARSAHIRRYFWN
jgi:hypothetical protein